MKTILVVALLCLAVSARFDFKEYAAPIIAKVNSIEGHPWTAGVNEYFIGRSFEDIKKMMGSLEEPEWLKLAEKEDTPINAALPENFDARQQWPKCQSVSEVRDQSNCGSCWAFGAVEAISDRICITSNGSLQTRISSENLLSCCGFFCGSGCNGGYPSAAWRYYINTGIVTGDLYNESGFCQPYTLPPCEHHNNATVYPQCTSLPQYSTPTCSKSCVAGYSTSYNSDLHFGTQTYSITGVEKVKNEIFTNGPIEGTFTVYEDFLTYTSGVYVHTTGAALGGHAIKVIGWGTEGGIPYWLCTNSWNTQWGMAGFFKIKQGTCGINNGMVAGLVKN